MRLYHSFPRLFFSLSPPPLSPLSFRRTQKDGIVLWRKRVNPAIATMCDGADLPHESGRGYVVNANCFAVGKGYTEVVKKDCVFCTRPEIRERIIARDDCVFAFPTNIPITPGHTLIATVRCVSSFDDLTTEEVKALFSMRRRIVEALRTAFDTEGFHFAWNEGEVAGQNVPHLHLHIVPRKKGDTGITEFEPRKFLYRPGSREPSPERELQAVADVIKKALR